MRTETGDERAFFLVEVLWRGSAHYLIWQTDTRDEFLVKDGRVLVWTDRTVAESHATSIGIELSRSDSKYDFDVVRRFADAEIGLGAEELLNAWNLLSDLGRTIGSEALAAAESAVNDLYSLLFSLTSAGRVVDIAPSPLSVAETGRIRAFFQTGCDVLARVLDS